MDKIIKGIGKKYDTDKKDEYDKLVDDISKTFKELETKFKELESTSNMYSYNDLYVGIKQNHIEINKKYKEYIELYNEIKSNLSKTERIKIKANSLKDKIKGKLGIGSKSKNGKDEKKGKTTVEEK